MPQLCKFPAVRDFQPPVMAGTSVWNSLLRPQHRAELSARRMPQVWYMPVESDFHPPVMAGTLVWP